jgi:hypothetical protein
MPVGALDDSLATEDARPRAPIALIRSTLGFRIKMNVEEWGQDLAVEAYGPRR